MKSKSSVTYLTYPVGIHNHVNVISATSATESKRCHYAAERLEKAHPEQCSEWTSAERQDEERFYEGDITRCAATPRIFVCSNLCKCK